MDKAARRAENNKKVSAGVMSVSDCTAEENERFLAMNKKDLPDDVFRKADEEGMALEAFFRFVPVEVEDMQSHIAVQQADITNKILASVNSIKGMVTFFVVLTILNLLGGLIIAISFMSAFS